MASLYLTFVVPLAELPRSANEFLCTPKPNNTGWLDGHYRKQDIVVDIYIYVAGSGVWKKPKS